MLPACTGATAPPDEGAGFALYLVKPESSISQSELTQLELEPTPFISVDDILTYTWETHEIELNEAAFERVAGLEVPVTTGVPFVVCVGAERIYPGAFWISYSSMSYNGIVIDTLFAQLDDPLIRIQLGYPESTEFFEGKTCARTPASGSRSKMQAN